MTFVQLFMHMYTIWKHSSLSESFSFNASAPSILRAHGTTNVKGAWRVDAFRSRHWVLTTCGCPPAQDSSHHQGLSFLIGNPNLNLPLPRLHAGRGDNPNMKLKTSLVEKPGGHRRLATDIYLRSSIYNIDVCPLFQLDAVWPTQMQHKTEKNSKTSQ